MGIFMVRSSMRKWPLYAITVYRILATMGTFTLAAFDAPTVDNPARKSLAQDIFLILPNRFMCTPAIITANGNRFSLPRHCLLRAIMLPSLLAAGLGLLCQAVRPITNCFAIFLNKSCSKTSVFEQVPLENSKMQSILRDLFDNPTGFSKTGYRTSPIQVYAAGSRVRRNLLGV
jgi:hypothetical protein